MPNQLKENYSKLVDAKLRKSLVTKDNVIFNNRYEGDATAGAVKIPTRGEATVGDYNKATGANLDASNTGYITMAITKDKYVNEIIDGFDAAAVPDNIVADRLDSAGYSMANQMDVDGLDVLASQGTESEDTTVLTKATAYEATVDARTVLSDVGVPSDNRRWIIVTPTVYGLLLKSPDFIKAGDMSQEIVKTGAIGSIAGFNVYESSNMPAGVEFIAGHPDYATRAKAWAVPVKLQNLDASGKFIGASAVQGRTVYDHKVTKPQAIYVKTKA